MSIQNMNQPRKSNILNVSTLHEQLQFHVYNSLGKLHLPVTQRNANVNNMCNNAITETDKY